MQVKALGSELNELRAHMSAAKAHVSQFEQGVDPLTISLNHCKRDDGTTRDINGC